MNYASVNAMANAICGIKPAFEQPNKPSFIGDGMNQHQYTSRDGLTLDCHFEYEKAFAGSDVEPGYPESLELIYALVNGVDIAEVLCDDVKKLIEEEALCSMEMDGWNDEYDRAADRAEAQA